MKDISEALHDAEEFDRELVNGLQRAVGHAVTVGTMKARTEHAWHDQTYATRDSIRGEVRDTKKGAVGKFGPADTKGGENAVRLATGTPPHVIRPKAAAGFVGPLLPGQGRRSRGRNTAGQFSGGQGAARALAFQMGGTTVFARSVNHPGTKPDPYLDKAAAAAGEALEQGVEAAIDKALG